MIERDNNLFGNLCKVCLKVSVWSEIAKKFIPHAKIALRISGSTLVLLSY